MSAWLYWTCAKVFLPEGRADDHDVIRWHHCLYAYVEVRGLYKGVYMSPRALVWVFGCSTFSCTLLGATDPLLQLSQCLLRSETITIQGSVLYLTVSAQGYLGYPELVCFSCLQVTRYHAILYLSDPVLEQQEPQSFSANWCMWDKLWLWWAHQPI